MVAGVSVALVTVAAVIVAVLLIGLLVATHEMNEFKDEYQTKVLRNARAFARQLADNGLRVEGDPSDGYTMTHQVVLRVSEFGDGADIARRLEENGIIVNYQALPDDETFLVSSGLRTGVSEMTRFGMDEDDFGPVAILVNNACVSEPGDILHVEVVE